MPKFKNNKDSDNMSCLGNRRYKKTVSLSKITQYQTSLKRACVIKEVKKKMVKQNVLWKTLKMNSKALANA